jgi:PAS domain S-box-containing protein
MSPTVLVVDDAPDARLVMAAALRKAGFEVRLAEGGHDALRQFRAAPCELVMLDVSMPDLSGHEVCTILRAEAGPTLPIVMVTGMDDLASVEKAYESGATDFIAKPVNWALIGHRVRYLLRGSQAMLDLEQAQARHAAVLSAIPDLLFELDLDGRYHDYRAPKTELLAAPPEAFLGRTVAEVLPREAAEISMAALHRAYLHGSDTGAQIELTLPRGNTWFELSVARKAGAEGERPRFIVLSRDITERKQTEARIARLAFYDSLTGLPNRRAFLERVEREVRRAERARARLAVLYMDLDGFKNINDTMGHAAGDLVLQWAADRLRDGLRPADLLSRPLEDFGDEPNEAGLARLGGDEFTALLVDLERAEDALTVAQRIGQLMRRPFDLDGREVTLTASIGIALYPDDGSDAATLLQHADTAMYHAKGSGRDNAQVYSAELTDELMERMDLDASLRAAVERQALHLVFQPQIDSASGRVESVEALIRWNHPERGPIGPQVFIPLAEQNGLIGRIGQWVLETACAEAARWNRSGPPVPVAVNLSPCQFADAGLAQRVLDTLARHGLSPGLLEIEVTEGVLMDHSPTPRATLETLRAHGVRLALDDFGTGYSSLAYLTRMPIDKIKIDRSFVAALPDGGHGDAIVRAMLAMAGSLGMRVTAEGVETPAQARALDAMGCRSFQGWHFARPVVAAELAPLLNRHWSLAAA